MKELSAYTLFQTTAAYLPNANHYDVVSIPNLNHKIGRSEEGWPKFFVKTIPGKTTLHNIKGELLWVEYSVDCSVVDETNAKTDAIFTIITLRSEEESLQSIFLEIFYLALISMPSDPSESELAIKIEGLLSIFSALRKPSLFTIQGLWAELLVIERCANPEALAKAWHNSPTSKYDFTQGEDKIEVKSTSSEERTHRFSLDQLNPSESSNLLIASVKVRESAEDENGLSVFGLYERIRSRIGDVSVRMHVYSVLVSTLGNNYDKAVSIYFDYSQGKDSLAYYDYKDIPKPIPESIPPLVTGVKFNSTISGIKTVFENGMYFSESSLYAAIQ